MNPAESAPSSCTKPSRPTSAMYPWAARISEGRRARFRGGVSLAAPQGTYWLIREKSTAPGGELPGNPVHGRLGLAQPAGEEQVADHHPTAQQPALHEARPGLAVHLQNGLPGHLRVVRRPGVGRRGLCRHVLEIGQVNLDLPLQRPQSFQALIPPGVPHHGDGERLFQGRQNGVGVVGGVDQVDVVGPLGDELVEDGAQPGNIHRLSEAPVADGLVLAEQAPQAAPGEEHGARPPLPGDGGLLPPVEGRPGEHRGLRHGAAAAALCRGAQSAAPAGTQIADHPFSSSPAPRAASTAGRKQAKALGRA